MVRPGGEPWPVPIEPKADEDQSAWMDRCVGEMMESGDRDNDQAVAICLDIWRNKSGGKAIVFKQVAHPETKKFDFVMSDASIDRYGDVVEADGWDLTNFKRHPIALFNHDAMQPIGSWSDVRVERGRLCGRLKIEEGVSPDIDKWAELVRRGVLKGVSVGFKPIEREPIKEGKGVRYKKHRLLE